MDNPQTGATPEERRVGDRRQQFDQEDAYWRWMNMLLNGNERRTGQDRRSDPSS
ncbi:hypothetical protein N8I74_13065 [Chitiniphilus purpureus]|uniref:Uncharacterized protein n=1 Tax=Chitiniphilus purpureus TaxID=2981137 RepID=A0ABY6DIR8_9NEIS|nr:hypothetical protein [Chitiniphilus sp. CD1]UXY14242.1 hypothetical protein N8I74_13065 [Chitiniphilus sp. CD1]